MKTNAHAARLSALTAALLIGMVLVGNGCTPATTPVTNETPIKQDEINIRLVEKSLPGKTMEEVKQLFGSPGNQSRGSSEETWSYHHRFYDGLTSNHISTVRIEFKHDRVDSVTW